MGEILKFIETPPKGETFGIRKLGSHRLGVLKGLNEARGKLQVFEDSRIAQGIQRTEELANLKVVRERERQRKRKRLLIYLNALSQDRNCLEKSLEGSVNFLKN